MVLSRNVALIHPMTYLRIQVLIVFAQFLKQHFCASLKVIWLDFEINIKKNNNKLEAQQGQSLIKTKTVKNYFC